MLKKLALVSGVAILASFTSSVFAAENLIGFQFRVPFQATADSKVGNASGQSIVLSFFLDQDTEIGILSETAALRDKTAPGGGIVPVTGYQVTALRISKNVSSVPVPVYIGMHLGNMNVMNATGSSGASTMADVFGGVRLLTSKGKVASFLGVELDYRIAKPALTGTAISDMGGLMLNFSAGLTF
jgi:hypothetical protein